MNPRFLLLSILLLLIVAAAQCVAQGGRGVLKFDTTDLDFGDVVQGTCATNQVSLYNAGNDSVLLTQIWADQLGASEIVLVSPQLPVTVGPRDSFNINLQWCPRLDTQNRTERRLIAALVLQYQTIADTTVQLDSSGRLGGRATVPLTVDTLTTSSDSLDFSATPLPNCATKSVLLKNISTNPRIISLNVQGSTRFSIDSPIQLQRIQLSPNDSLAVVVRYCPDSLSADYAFINITDANQTQIGQVILVGNGISPWSLLPAIAIDSVDSGKCNTQSIGIRSLSALPFTIDTTPANPPFTLQFSRVQVNGPGDSIVLAVTFCPDSVGMIGRSFVVRDLTGRPFAWLRVTGAGRAPNDVPPARSITLRLGDTGVRVGESIRLPLNAQPALEASDIVDSLRLLVILPPRALFFNGAEAAAPGWNVSSKRIDNSTVLVALRPDRGAAPTTTPLALRLTGLTTGSPANNVVIEVDSLGRLTVPVTVGSGGLVLLEGCDLGTDPRLSRRVSLQGLHLDPVGGTTLRVDYRAPLHARALLRLADVSGSNVQTFELPPGTDADATATIAIERTAPGLCVVELRAGDSRATTLMMIAP